MSWVAVGIAVVALAANVVSRILQPKQETEKLRPGDISGFPTSTENRPVPILYGTVRINAPNVLWWGDRKTFKIKKTFGRGIFSKKETVGFRYAVGMDLGICQGPIGTFNKLWFGDRLVWDKDSVSPLKRTSTVISTSGVTFTDYDGNVVAFEEAPWWSETGSQAANDYAIRINFRNFGGRNPNDKRDGVQGIMRMHRGAADESVNAYLQARVPDETILPAYRGIARIVWQTDSTGLPGLFGSHKFDGVLGNSPNIPAWAIEASRFPDPVALGLGVGEEAIDTWEANPVACLWEIIVRAGIDESLLLLHLADWQAAATTCVSESNGYSFLHSDLRNRDEVANEIVRQIDATVFETGDGGIKIRLLRQTYDPDPGSPSFLALPLLDSDSIKDVRSPGRGSWEKTYNEVAINYDDRDQQYDRKTAISQDLANQSIQGRDVLFSSVFPGVKTAALAGALAGREMRQYGFPWLPAKFLCTRKAATLEPGQAFRVTYPQKGIVDVVFRVVDIDLNTLENGDVIVDSIEDVFGVGSGAFGDPGISGWVDPDPLPSKILTRHLADMPRFFSEIDDDVADKTLRRLFTVAVLETDASNYEQYGDFDATAADDLQLLGSADDFTPMGTLDALLAIDNGEGLTTQLAVAVTIVGNIGFDNGIDTADEPNAGIAPPADLADILINGQGLALLENGTDEEWIGYELTDSTLQEIDTLHRGLLDTEPREWPIGTRVWFPSGAFGSSLNPFPAHSPFNVRLLPIGGSGAGQLDQDLPGDADDIAYTPGGRELAPIPPAYVRFDDATIAESFFPVEIDPTFDVHWRMRNKATVPYLDWIDPTGDPETTSGGTADGVALVPVVEVTNEFGVVILAAEEQNDTATSRLSIAMGAADIRANVRLTSRDKRPAPDLNSLRGFEYTLRRRGSGLDDDFIPRRRSGTTIPSFVADAPGGAFNTQCININTTGAGPKDQYLQTLEHFGDYVTGDAFGFSFWVKWIPTGGKTIGDLGEMLFGASSSTNPTNGWGVRFSGLNTMRFFVNHATIASTSGYHRTLGFAPPANVWFNFAGTYDQGTQTGTFWRNAVSVGTPSGAPTSWTKAGRVGLGLVGDNAVGPDDDWPAARFSEIALYSDVLTQTDANFLFNGGVPQDLQGGGAPDNLVRYWRPNETGGDSAVLNTGKVQQIV